MCGLLGFVGQSNPENLEAGGAWINRRGPDGLTSWQSVDGRVRLVHAWLAIADLREIAQQPMSLPGAELTLGFVGEIYNHIELRSTLSHKFQTDSDTETLLALINERGVDAIRELRGMFAIAMVNEKDRTVTLMRDPVGKKPLFLLERSEGSYFGSSVLALSAAAAHVEIDSEAALEWWSLGFSPPNVSVLAGCKPLLPGEVVTMDWTGRVLTRRFLSPAQGETLNTITSVEAVEELDRLVRQSVKRRLMGNPNPVALLSGGVDSTVVSKYAVAERPGIRLLTLGSRWFKSKDESFARIAAEKLKTPVEVVMIGRDPVGERVARLVKLQDEPLGMISFVPMASLAEIAGQSSRVLLTGDGGDEVFAGYGRPADWRGDHNPKNSKANFRSGPEFASWNSDYARQAAGLDLVGHGFAKLDRATAEQAVEARCPLLCWDVMSFARSLPSEILMDAIKPKALLKRLLGDWPDSFLEREKEGFRFRLRGLWGMSSFKGLREGVAMEAVDRFRLMLPKSLSSNPSGWSTAAIFQDFPVAYKLYTWSAFLVRLRGGAALNRGLDIGEQTEENEISGLGEKLHYLACSVKRRLTTRVELCPNCGAADHVLVQRKYLATELRRCGLCKIMFRSPCLSPSDEIAFYVSEAYSAGVTTDTPKLDVLCELKRTRFEGTRKDASPRLALLKALGCTPQDTHVLDFGCSWGYTAWQMQAAGYRVTGLEVGKHRCGFAVSRMGINAVQNEALLEGPFDVFFTSHVLEHVPSVTQKIVLAKRLVRPGGLILIMTPNGSAAHRALDPTGWQQMWGHVHPNLLDDQFYLALAHSGPIYLSSDPYSLGEISAWAKDPSAGKVVGDLSGPELLAVFRV
jgi:asparagine synthase (glutamine-hydrolysing)